MKLHKTLFSITLIILFSLTAYSQNTETSTTEAKQEVKKQENTQQATTTSEVKKKVVRKKSKPYMDGGTIQEQFDYMMTKANRYEDKKVVKISALNKFNSNAKDTLQVLKKDLGESNVKIGTQNNEITGLKQELQTVKTQLEETVNSKDSMKFLGMELPKATYNTIMWVLILGSLAVAGMCFFLFKRSNVITVETKETLEDVREEYETHRKSALVREQKLARRLQDEVIKNKNLGL